MFPNDVRQQMERWTSSADGYRPLTCRPAVERNPKAGETSCLRQLTQGRRFQGLNTVT